MFEKRKGMEQKSNFRAQLYGLLLLLKLAEKEEVSVPEPYLALIDEKSWTFTDEDTYLVECEEKPEYSCIVHMEKGEDGDIAGGTCIYYQPEIMEDMKQQGFGVVSEGLEVAKKNYHLFYEFPAYQPRDYGQASLN